VADQWISVHRSDLEKIHDALDKNHSHHTHRDAMNAAIHLAEKVRWSPITSETEAALQRVNELLAEVDRQSAVD
jgi:ribosomal 50S subunit-associated protein YjgA (DUF615 family)